MQRGKGGSGSWSLAGSETGREPVPSAAAESGTVGENTEGDYGAPDAVWRLWWLWKSWESWESWGSVRRVPVDPSDSGPRCRSGEH